MKADMRKAAFTILAPVLLSLGGCSLVTTFGYNHADTMLRHTIDDYTSFDEHQREEIRRDVDEYLRWHRRYALPEYIAFLQALHARLERDAVLQPKDAVRVRSELARLYKFTMTPFVRPAAHVMSTLNIHQVEELRMHLEKKSREAREEMLPNGERDNRLARAKAHVKLVERLVGDLSRSQEKQVMQLSLRIPFVTDDYLRQRDAKQAALIALLRSRPGEEKIARFLLDWINGAEPVQPGKDRHAVEEAYNKAMDDMVIGTYALLTAEQRKHLQEKIADYIKAMQRLHQEAEPSGPVQQPVLPRGGSAIVHATLP